MLSIIIKESLLKLQEFLTSTHCNKLIGAYLITHYHYHSKSEERMENLGFTLLPTLDSDSDYNGSSNKIIKIYGLQIRGCNFIRQEAMHVFVSLFCICLLIPWPSLSIETFTLFHARLRKKGI